MGTRARVQESNPGEFRYLTAVTSANSRGRGGVWVPSRARFSSRVALFSVLSFPRDGSDVAPVDQVVGSTRAEDVAGPCTRRRGPSPRRGSVAVVADGVEVTAPDDSIAGNRSQPCPPGGATLRTAESCPRRRARLGPPDWPDRFLSPSRPRDPTLRAEPSGATGLVFRASRTGPGSWDTGPTLAFPCRRLPKTQEHLGNTVSTPSLACPAAAHWPHEAPRTGRRVPCDPGQQPL